ncbi:hypothetical protein GLOTRDRAFT_132398 [Gloeophyllum trabeum ATCC 11539]|uniref:Transmembrane protein n=1 Tax=Gloeophyllum trabeum (strain ATCC 11539 / FP-39264 / Madison 617) TaxID=670483 RepID=S7RI44_GLOTA|nr:uncharacterized protein GLOTRDRAFT_132398 [Gloeophyllum trabeum ATCC 11539]EPQ52279.1 hypothetical protein GLOTRDRAFT_132398 [Gloeophyllum trabeum ATCC 11539]
MATATSTPASSPIKYTPKTSSFLFGAVLVFVAVFFAILGCFMAPRRLRRRQNALTITPVRRATRDRTAKAATLEKREPVFAEVAATPCAAPSWPQMMPLSAYFIRESESRRNADREPPQVTPESPTRRLRTSLLSRYFRRRRPEAVESGAVEMQEAVPVKGVEVAVLIKMPSPTLGQTQRARLAGEMALGQARLPIDWKGWQS